MRQSLITCSVCTHIAHTKCVASSIELCVIYCSHRYFAFLRTLTLLHTGVRCAQIHAERVFFWVDIEFSFQRERRASEKINYQNNRLTKHVVCICLCRHCRRRHRRHIEYILVEQVFEQNVSFSCELIQIELFVFSSLFTHSHLLCRCVRVVGQCEREVKY